MTLFEPSAQLRTITDADVAAISARIVSLLGIPKPARRPREKRLPFENVDAQTIEARTTRAGIAANQSSVTRENADLQDMPAPLVQALLKRPHGLL